MMITLGATSLVITSLSFVSIIIYLYKTYDSLKSKEIDLIQRENKFNNSIQDERQKIRQKERDILDAFLGVQEKLGFDLNDLISVNENANSLDLELRSQSNKVNKYIKRLSDLNEKKKLAFNARPILTASAAKISEMQLFCSSKEEFLERELALCKQIQKEKNIALYFSTKKTKCIVLRVVDGDTFDVQVGDSKVRIRTVGYDTPEVCHPKKGFGHWGIQASEAAESIVKNGKEFNVFLDSIGFSMGWTNDRYGRTLAHLEVDGVLIGESLLSGGHAEIVDVFPMQEEVISLYRKAEYNAKINDIGMWNDINRYKLDRRPAHQKTKWNLADIINNQQEINITKDILRDVLSDMLGSVLAKSKNSLVVHSDGCHHLSRINNTESIQITEDVISGAEGKIRPCKHCHGDDLILELLN